MLSDNGTIYRKAEVVLIKLFGENYLYVLVSFLSLLVLPLSIYLLSLFLLYTSHWDKQPSKLIPFQAPQVGFLGLCTTRGSICCGQAAKFKQSKAVAAAYEDALLFLRGELKLITERDASASNEESAASSDDEYDTDASKAAEKSTNGSKSSAEDAGDIPEGNSTSNCAVLQGFGAATKHEAQLRRIHGHLYACGKTP